MQDHGRNVEESRSIVFMRQAERGAVMPCSQLHEVIKLSDIDKMNWLE